VVFTRVKVAVFIDGCFWHGCPTHYRAPRSNSQYWEAKLEQNRSRDADISETLREAGWTELRFWSHEDPIEVAERIHQAICAVNNDSREVRRMLTKPRRSTASEVHIEIWDEGEHE
jgi:DNA mismatch endonuclease (patch repair protein)